VLAASSIVPLNNPSLYAKITSYLGNRHPGAEPELARAFSRPGWLLRFLWEAGPRRRRPASPPCRR
jgi:D-amino-acid dehydrogenase